MQGRGGASDWSRSSTPQPNVIYNVGIYGWRKRCLYFFVLLLMVLIIINLALTIWILKVMDFSVHGMGKLRITDEGIRVEGRAEFLKPLYISKLQSDVARSLYLMSNKNITIHAKNEKGEVVSALVIADKKIESYCDTFSVQTPSGQQLFYVDENEVRVGPEKIKIIGEGGAVFDGSVQTPLVQAETAKPLKLESPTRDLEVNAAKNIGLKATVGTVTVNSLQEVILKSQSKSIHLNSSYVALQNIMVSSPSGSGSQYPGVYQVCVCDNTGRLFLAAADGQCQATLDVCR